MENFLLVSNVSQVIGVDVWKRLFRDFHADDLIPLVKDDKLIFLLHFPNNNIARLALLYLHQLKVGNERLLVQYANDKWINQAVMNSERLPEELDDILTNYEEDMNETPQSICKWKRLEIQPNHIGRLSIINKINMNISLKQFPSPIHPNSINTLKHNIEGNDVSNDWKRRELMISSSSSSLSSLSSLVSSPVSSLVSSSPLSQVTKVTSPSSLSSTLPISSVSIKRPLSSTTENEESVTSSLVRKEENVEKLLFHYRRGELNDVVYIRNLGRSIGLIELKRTIEELCHEMKCQMNEINIRYFRKGRLRHQAFIQFPSKAAAEKYLNYWHMRKMRGRHLIISFGNERQ
ncbi:hypothetical protein SNEBB_006638 [Seison nebaliae]|nr:hypothetical protein SNEBB_006638 [Seison nebaliae]